MATVSAFREDPRPADTPVSSVEDAFETASRYLAGAPVDEIVIAHGQDTDLPVTLRRNGGADIVLRFATRHDALEFYRLAWSRLRLGP